MVAGYIIDGVAALHRRWRGGGGAGGGGGGAGGGPAGDKAAGGNGSDEMSHNYKLCQALPSRIKWAFWHGRTRTQHPLYSST